ncbi:type IV pilin protein [Algiphilus sp. W345]|uniref:Type IV pilin protein n=1 Tax=Banduia mediterranea TaxID=3075609 RepID=A0ABU2WEM9_9GAMM|nr:type IV pilin protein [Algiphilus sp. W345]MDT0496324.1 type IV pilin protein [Algiphilus sp. W345]
MANARQTATAPRGTPHGFTLIELMIVVAIATILTVIALPAYQQYIRKSQRDLATTALADLASRQQAFHIKRRSYAGSFEPLVAIDATKVYLQRNGQYVASADEDSIYLLSLLADGIQAVPKGRQAKDECLSLSVAYNGQRSATATGHTAAEARLLCWR